MISNKTIIEMSRKLTNLRILSMAGPVPSSSCIQDEAIISIAENCNKLKSINLSGCKCITDNAIISIAENCNKLTSINLSRCKIITDDAIKTISNNCKELESLNLKKCYLITDSGPGMDEIMTNCLRLRTMVLSSGLTMNYK